MPFTVPASALLAMAIVLPALVVIEMSPPAPPAPGSSFVLAESAPTPPWLVAIRALPMGVQGLRVRVTPLGMAVLATLSSKMTFAF